MSPDRTDEEELERSRMTLGEHLDELRSRLIKGALAIAVGFVIAWVLRDDVTRLVTRPYRQAMDRLEAHYVAEAQELLAVDSTKKRTDFFISADPEDLELRDFRVQLVALKPQEAFIFQLKICLYVSLVLGAPVLLWQMWKFVAAGLYERERRAITRYFPFSLLAFAVGILFGYLVIVPYGIFFLNKSVSIEIALPSITMGEFLTFLSGLCLAFGVVFQLPLVQTFLGRMGVVDAATMARYRPHFVVAAFVVAALLTPPDPFTQAMMAIPLVVLYELGILGARARVKGSAT